jgi:hypothetical protein
VRRTGVHRNGRVPPRARGWLLESTQHLRESTRPAAEASGENVMADPVALNNQTHRLLRVTMDKARHESAGANVIGVIPHEFKRLVAHFPIFFARSPENGQLEPVVLLGFQNGENLFVTDGVWDAAYLPLQVQREPFSLVPRRDAAPGSTSLDLALDVNLPEVQTREGERLFTDDGQTTPFLKNVGSIMSTLVAGSREAHAFTARLSELNLLEPVRIDIGFVDASETKLEGLYWIAATVLKALPAVVLAELRDREYLEWLYFQMASLSHVPALVARKNRHISGAARN